MGDKIVCLVGESGSGKSTLAELLEKEGYNYIESYTTRKPRYKGERGHTFINKDNYEFNFDNKSHFKILKLDKEIEGFTVGLPLDYVAYTFYNGEHYFATRDQYKGKGISIYVIDPAGIKDLKNNVEDAEIVVIYLNIAESQRFVRMELRIDGNCTDDEYYKELKKINGRIKHDREAFKIIQTDYCVDANRSIEEVLKDVKSIIEG